MLLFVVFIVLFVPYEVQSEMQLSDLNQQFRNAYQEARNQLLSTIDPLIILYNGNVILIHHGIRTSVPFRPQVFDDLKSIAHIPFTIYLLLFSVESNDYHLSSNQKMKLESYLKDILTVRQSLMFTPSSEIIMCTQYDIIDLSIDYLRPLLESEYVNQTVLNNFCFEARMMFSANIARAARSQVDVLHSIVYPWYTQLFNETERQTLKILVMGPKTVRDGLVEKLYFYELLNEHHEGKRILYAENVSDEKRAMTILGSWFLDTYAGDAFYDDSSRLHRDLMANEGFLYIKKLFNSTNN